MAARSISIASASDLMVSKYISGVMRFRAWELVIIERYP